MAFVSSVPKYFVVVLCLHYCGLVLQFDTTLATNIPVNTVDSDKIVGGVQAELHEFLFIATLTDEHSFCACSIIHKEWVLTAAHCAGSPASQYKVTANAYNIRKPAGDEITVNVSKVIRHPKYNGNTGANDIALMKLSTALPLNEKIKTIPLAPHNFVPGEIGIAAGWGVEGETSHEQPAVIRKVKIPLITQEQCKKMYEKSNNTKYNVEILPSVLCAGNLGQSACYGDSGGPFLCPNGSVEYSYLCGIVSSGAKCGDVGIYTRVSFYREWIAEEIGDSFGTL